MPFRLYHPNLKPPDNECVVMDENQVAILADSGWLPAPEPEETPGLVPEPVRYEPVTTKKTAAATKKAAVKESTD